MSAAKTAGRATTACLAAFSLTGCVTAGDSLLPGAVVHPDNPAVAFVPVDTTEKGCTAYTKRSLEPGVVTDAAIWYRDANGDFTLDANACVPEED